MNIHRAARRGFEHLRRQNQAIGGDDKDVRPRCRHPRRVLRRLETLRLEQRQSALRGENLYRAWRRSQAAAGRPIRLRQYQRDVVARTEQARQRALGEGRGTGENETQESGLGRLAQLLGELCADALLLELRQVLDEHLTLQVIHFVLNAYG